MAIPIYLREITKEQAERIVKRHPDGVWEGLPWNSDYVFEGKKAPNKPYRYYEMVRVTDFGWGKPTYETGRVSL